jgi:hypothetical protein
MGRDRIMGRDVADVLCVQLALLIQRCAYPTLLVGNVIRLFLCGDEEKISADTKKLPPIRAGAFNDQSAAPKWPAEDRVRWSAGSSPPSCRDDRFPAGS